MPSDDLTQNMINSVIHRRNNQEIKHCTHKHMHIENLNPTYHSYLNQVQVKLEIFGEPKTFHSSTSLLLHEDYYLVVQHWYFIMS